MTIGKRVRNEETIEAPQMVFVSGNPNTVDEAAQGTFGFDLTNNALWVNSDGAAGWLPVSNIIAEVVDNSGGLVLTGAFQGVSMDTDVRTDFLYSFTAPSTTITVNYTGDVFVFVDCSVSVTAGAARSDCEIQLVKNGTIIGGTTRYIYSRDVSQGKGSATVSGVVVSVTSGDTIGLEVKRLSGTNTIATVAGGSRLQVATI